MANNENEIVDSNTSCNKRTDYFVYYNNPNATNEDSLATGKHKFFHKILKYLKRSTVPIIQNKKKIFNTEKNTSTLCICKSEEKIATCTSLSSIVDNVIESDAKAVAKIKQRIRDATTSTARIDEVFDDKVAHENLSGVVGHEVRGAPYRYAQYAEKYVNNAVPESGCGINIGTESDTVDGEFSLRTSPDAFAKTYEERQHADFILEKIAKVSNALTERAGAEDLVSAKEVTSTGYEMGKETFANTKPSISSIIRAKKIPTVTAATKAVMQSETLTDTGMLMSSSSHFAPDSFSACLDSNIQVIPSVKHLQHTRSISCMYPERNYLQDIAVPTIVREKKKEEEQLLNKTLDKYVFAFDKTDYAIINAIIINCILKLRRKSSQCSDSYRPSGIQTYDSKQRTVTVKVPSTRRTAKVPSTQISRVKEKSSQIITKKGSKQIDKKGSKQIDKKESYCMRRIIKKEPKQVAKKEPTQVSKKEPTKIAKKKPTKTYISKDGLQQTVSIRDEKSKYRAKYRFADSIYVRKKEKVPEKCKDDKSLKYQFPPSMHLKELRAKSISCIKKPTMEMHQDCRSKPLRCQPSIRDCEDIISSNVCLGRPNATLSYAHCRLPQDSGTTLPECRTNCRSLTDNHISSRCYSTNDCAKHQRCCPGYYCKDSYPVWNNNQYCGRNRSCCWTKGNLYFTYPWTSEIIII